jgi:hypothetical protein
MAASDQSSVTTSTVMAIDLVFVASSGHCMIIWRRVIILLTHGRLVSEVLHALYRIAGQEPAKSGIESLSRQISVPDAPGPS